MLARYRLHAHRGGVPFDRRAERLRQVDHPAAHFRAVRGDPHRAGTEIPAARERAQSGSCFSATRCCRGRRLPPTLPSDWKCFRGFPREHMPGRIQVLVELLGLSEFGHYYPRALSGGMRQRVALDGWSPMTRDHTDGRPFGAWTRRQSTHGLRVASYLDRLAQDVVSSTHDIEEAIGYPDRILVMTDTARPDQIGISRRTAVRPRDLPVSRKMSAFHQLSERIWRDIVAGA